MQPNCAAFDWNSPVIAGRSSPSALADENPCHAYGPYCAAGCAGSQGRTETQFSGAEAQTARKSLEGMATVGGPTRHTASAKRDTRAHTWCAGGALGHEAAAGEEARRALDAFDPAGLGFVQQPLVTHGALRLLRWEPGPPCIRVLFHPCASSHENVDVCRDQRKAFENSRSSMPFARKCRSCHGWNGANPWVAVLARPRPVV